jgi:hypothetical protein
MPEEESNIVFIGPSQGHGILQRNQTFVSWDEMPPPVKQLLEVRPILKSFFVPIRQFTQANRQMGKAQHAIRRSTTVLVPRRSTRPGLILPGIIRSK